MYTQINKHMYKNNRVTRRYNEPFKLKSVKNALFLFLIFSVALIGCDKDDERSLIPGIPLAETYPPIFSSKV